jgi:integrase
MGRPRKQSREPFWRSERDCWYVHHGTRTVRLARDKDEAWRRWHELMARPPVPEPPPVAGPDAEAIVVLDAFLDWCQKNRAPRTYAWYQAFFQALVDTIPDGLPARDLKPYHLTQVMDARAGWGNNTRHDFVTAVSRAFNWALRQRLIDRNPVALTEKLAREARELAATPADVAAVLAAVKEPNFRDLVRFVWESGVRPQEARAVEARHDDFALKRVVFPPREAKGRKRHRVVYLTDAAAEILRPLAEARPEGALFRNSEGRPWTKDAINCAFCRLEKKLGRKLHLGALRKGYCTEALKNGVDTHTLAHLMGHADAVMISRVYARVQADPRFMAEAARRAKGS